MTNTRLPQKSRWDRNYAALQQYVTRTGNALVPTSHTELHDDRLVPIGAWVAYMRQRARFNKLPQDRVDALAGLQGWAWGPLRPGPSGDDARDIEIINLRNQGHSLQTIAKQVGLSRQRVHQIAKAKKA